MELCPDDSNSCFQLPFMLSQTSVQHPGFNSFVFTRSVVIHTLMSSLNSFQHLVMKNYTKTTFWFVCLATLPLKSVIILINIMPFARMW